jgi:hypothetical protein|nr:MAG TPA: hypothetical protein [Caudoviricetes sp.]
MPRRKMTYREKRAKAYEQTLPVGDQLDAMLKAFDMVLQSGGDLPYELIDIIEKWQDIKNKYPEE